MKRAALLLTAIMVLSTVAFVPIAGLAATDGDRAQTADNESVAPGERLSGVVGASEAEIDGEVEERSFGLAVANASDNETRADLVAQQRTQIEQRIDDLEQRMAELDEARANDSISEGEYQAEVTKLSAQKSSLSRQANASATVAGGLPADLLDQKGINVTAIQTLQDRASQLGGQDVARIAQSIAGPNVGADMRPANAGERIPDDPGDQRRDGGQPDDTEDTQDDNGTPEITPGGPDSADA